MKTWPAGAEKPRNRIAQMEHQNQSGWSARAPAKLFTVCFANFAGGSLAAHE